MTPKQYAIAQARKAAQRDHKNRLCAWPMRHDALQGSAWEKWYLQAYAEQGKPFEPNLSDFPYPQGDADYCAAMGIYYGLQQKAK